MYDDIVNLWSEDSDFNVVKTWLVGGTDGQTYSITDRFLPKLKIDESKYCYDYCDIEERIDNIIGFKHDYKLDDPMLDHAAQEMVDRMDNLIRDINNNPQRYFVPVFEKPINLQVCNNCTHVKACEINNPKFERYGCCAAFNPVLHAQERR